MPVLRVEKSVLDVPIPLSKTIHQCSIIDQHLRDSDHCDSPCPFGKRGGKMRKLSSKHEYCGIMNVS